MGDFREFINAIKREDLAEVKRLFKKEFINERTKRGLSALHVACYNNKGEIMKYLLSVGYNIEEVVKSVSGWRCIHYAAGRGKVEVLKTLLEEGCDSESRDYNGMTALQIASRFKREKCVEILKENEKNEKNVKEDLKFLAENSLSKITNPQTGETLLDKLLSNKDPRILEAIKSKPVLAEEIDEWRNLDIRKVNPQSYRLLRECMIARCFHHKDEDGVFKLCTVEIINKDSLFRGPSFLETAVESKVHGFCLQVILLKIIKVDKSMERAEIIAVRNNNTIHVDLIARRKRYLNEQKKKGISRLKIAVLENDPEMIAYIMNTQSVDDEREQGDHGAALSLSYSINHMDCVESLQNNKVNVNTLDKLKQSPLHMAIYNREEEHSEYLVNNMTNLEEEDFMNFTVLERTVMNDCREVCERLVKKGARCDRIIKIKKKWLKTDPDLRMILHNTPHLRTTYSETIYTFCFKVNRTVYPCLLGTIDHHTIDIVDGDGNTLLHLCAVSLKADLCSQLVGKEARVDIRNKNQRTPLLELLVENFNSYSEEKKEDFIETIKVLINGGASLDCEDSSDDFISQIPSKYDNEEIILGLIQRKEILKSINKSDFLSWLNNKNYKFIKELIPLIKDSLLQEWITKDIIESCITNDDLSLSTSLYDKACRDVQINVVEEMLNKAARNDDIRLFEEMIEHEISLRSSLEGGESLLHYLIKEKKYDFITVVLRSRNGLLFIERQNNIKKLPLHVCVECEYWDVLDRLITDTKSVNHEDDDGNTPLSLLLTKMSETEDRRICDHLMHCVKTLILKCADIYQKNQQNKSVITNCTKSLLKSEIESFFRDNPPRPQPSSILKTSSTVYNEPYGEHNEGSLPELNYYNNLPITKEPGDTPGENFRDREHLDHVNQLDSEPATTSQISSSMYAEEMMGNEELNNHNSLSKEEEDDSLLCLLHPPVDYGTL